MLAVTFRIGSWSMSIYCMYTMASDCVNRLNVEGSRDSAYG